MISLIFPNRQPGQNTLEELRSRDFREELEVGEREVKDKKDKDRPPPPRSFTGRRCREVVMEKSHNSYSSGWRLFNTKSLLVVDPSFFFPFFEGVTTISSLFI